MIPYDTIITDGVLTLRPVTLDDTHSLVDAVQESVAQIMPWMSWCTLEYNENIARSWLAILPEAWEAGTQYALAIKDAQSGKILGGTGLIILIINTGLRTWVIGCAPAVQDMASPIAPSAW